MNRKTLNILLLLILIVLICMADNFSGDGEIVKAKTTILKP